MRYMLQYTARKRQVAYWGAALAGVALLWVGAIRPQEALQDAQVADRQRAAQYRDAASQEVVTLARAPLPLEVSGVVQGVDEVVVRARISGTVARWLVREGSPVRAGALLARQEVPEARAALSVAQARRALVRTEQALALVRARAAESIALLTQTAAEGTAAARISGARAAAETSARALLASVDGALTEVAVALDFIDNHQYLFDAMALSSFQDVAYSFFGYEPTFLGNGSLHGAPEAPVPQALARRVQALREAARPSGEEVSRLAALVALQLRATQQLLITAEPEVLANFSPGDATYDAYYAVRTRVASAAGALEGGMEKALRAGASREEARAREQGTVAVREEEAARARAEAQYAARIARHMDRVQEALVAARAARLSLAEVRAPFSGEVLERYVKRGAYVREGEALLRMASARGRELAVQVPFAFAAGLRPGQPLVREGAVVGRVDRFAPGPEGGMRVFITLEEGTWRVGEALRGTLLLEEMDALYAVPRAYVWFDSEGPFIRYEDGGVLRVTVVYDTPERFFVRAPEARAAALVPFRGAVRP